MANVNDPNLGLYFGWNYGETPWNGGMDKNMVILGGLAPKTVVSRTVSVEPAGVDGAVYFVPSGATGASWGANPETLAVYSSQSTYDINNTPSVIGWTFIPVQEGWSFTVQDENNDMVTWSVGGGDFVQSVDVTNFLEATTNYVATGTVDFSGVTRFTGTHTADQLELATLADITASISGQDFSDVTTLSGTQTITGDKTFSGTTTFTAAVTGVSGANGDHLATNDDVSTAIANEISLTDGGSGQSITNANTSGALEFKTLTSLDGSVTFVEDQGGDNIDFSVVTSTVVDFLDLTDTPASFGSIGQVVVVNGAGNGLEFADPVANGSFASLSDTPVDYVGQDGKYLTVDETGTQILFSTLPSFSTVANFVELTDVPNTIPADITYFLRANATGDALEFAQTIVPADSTDLGDMPSDLAGQSGNIIKVNGTEDAYEFGTAIDTFLGMTDTPAGYAPNAILKSTAGGIIFDVNNTADILVKEEGVDVGSYPTINFIGDNVTATQNGLQADITIGERTFLDEDDLVSDSATAVASQQSIKAYVDAQVASDVQIQGGYNATTNTPDLDTTPIAGIKTGHHYIVDTSSNDTFFSAIVEVGDSLIALQDDPTLESHWLIVQGNITTIDEDDMVSDSAIHVPTQQSVKSYVDNNSGTYKWDTSAAKTANFTAVAGTAYFVDTSGGAFTIDLPVGVIGESIKFKDVSGSFDIESLTLDPNGVENFEGDSASYVTSSKGECLTVTYSGATYGWSITDLT